jgi:hypothetical protein
MKTLIATLALLLAVPQAEEKKAPTREDMRRFLMFAVFEGLWEDGADLAVIKELRKKPFEYFIPKCYLCDAVRQGIDVYLAAPVAALGDAKGAGLPKPIADALKNPDRTPRLDGLRRLTERYVLRRFDRVKMSDEDRATMESFLQEARKQGMSVKEDSFGAFCPSCEGALRSKPKK